MGEATMQHRVWGKASLKRGRLIRDLKGVKPAMWTCRGWMFQLEKTDKEASVTQQWARGRKLSDDIDEVGGQELEHEGSCRILFYKMRSHWSIWRTDVIESDLYFQASLWPAAWRNSEEGPRWSRETTAVIRVRNDVTCTKATACYVYMCVL